ncbi:MAG: ABC-type transport system permease component LolE [Patescibacteria group bacterium]|nr:ABC-type transport system permease component LolE [Patescibacteria group bacterium]
MHRFLNTVRLGFFLAIRQVLRTSKWTTFLIVFIMMLTFLNLVATSGFLVGIIEGSSRAFKEQWTGDIMITNRNEKTHIERTNDILSALSSFPQIESYTPRLIAGATIEANWWEKRKEEDANTVGNQIAGIDPVKEDQTTNLSKAVVEGSWLTPGDARGIVIGTAFLQEYSPVADLVSLLRNVKPGVTVRVTVSGGKVTINPGNEGREFATEVDEKTAVTQEFIVRGIVDSKAGFVSSRAYILDSELKKMLGKTDGDVSEIAIKLKPGIDPYYIKTPLLKNGFGDYAKINTADEGAPEFLVNIKLFFSIIGTILGSVSVVVALITIFIIIYINALTRRRQIGIMKGIGVNNFAIEFSYICQAMFYVLFGAAIALVIIFGMMKPYIDAHPIDTPFALIVLVAEPASVAIKFLLVMIVSVFAGYLPARIIVSRNTLNAILGRSN